MKRVILIVLLTCGLFCGCSSMQNPFTVGSANYQTLQTICALETANTQQVKVACAALGLAAPPAPVPVSTPTTTK